MKKRKSNKARKAKKAKLARQRQKMSGRRKSVSKMSGRRKSVSKITRRRKKGPTHRNKRWRHGENTQKFTEEPKKKKKATKKELKNIQENLFRWKQVEEFEVLDDVFINMGDEVDYDFLDKELGIVSDSEESEKIIKKESEKKEENVWTSKETEIMRNPKLIGNTEYLTDIPGTISQFMNATTVTDIIDEESSDILEEEESIIIESEEDSEEDEEKEEESESSSTSYHEEEMNETDREKHWLAESYVVVMERAIREYQTKLLRNKFLKIASISDDIVLNEWVELSENNTFYFDTIVPILETSTNNLLRYDESVIAYYHMPKESDKRVQDELVKLPPITTNYSRHTLAANRNSVETRGHTMLNDPTNFMSLPDVVRWLYTHDFISDYAGETDNSELMALAISPIIPSIETSRINGIIYQKIRQRILRLCGPRKTEAFFTHAIQINSAFGSFPDTLKRWDSELHERVNLYSPDIDIIDPLNYISEYLPHDQTPNRNNITAVYLLKYWPRRAYNMLKKKRGNRSQYYHYVNSIPQEAQTAAVERYYSNDEPREVYGNRIPQTSRTETDRNCCIFKFLPVSYWNAAIPDSYIDEVTTYIFLRLLAIKPHHWGNIKDQAFAIKVILAREYVVKTGLNHGITLLKKQESTPLNRDDYFTELKGTTNTISIGPYKCDDTINRAANRPKFINEFIYRDIKLGGLNSNLTHHLLNKKIYKVKELKPQQNRSEEYWNIARKLAIKLIRVAYERMFSKDVSTYGRFLYTYYWKTDAAANEINNTEMAKSQSVRWNAVLSSILHKFTITDIFHTESTIGSATDPVSILQDAFKSFWILDKLTYKDFIQYLRHNKMDVKPIRTHRHCLLRSLIVIDLHENKRRSAYSMPDKTLALCIGNAISNYKGRVTDNICEKCGRTRERCYFQDRIIGQSEVYKAVSHFFKYHTENLRVSSAYIHVVDLKHTPKRTPDTNSGTQNTITRKVLKLGVVSNDKVTASILIVGGHAFPIYKVTATNHKYFYDKARLDTLIYETPLSFEKTAITRVNADKETDDTYVSFDIETFNKHRTTGELIPYAVGAEVIGSRTTEPAIFIGRKCFIEFLDWLGGIMTKNKNIKLFAHNGSKFDFYFMLLSIINDSDKLKHKWEILNPIMKGSRIITATIMCVIGNNISVCQFRDTYLYFPYSLRFLAYIFGTEVQKSAFAYESIGNFEDVKTRKDTIRNYLVKDVLSLSGIVVAIKNHFMSLYSINPYDKITSAGIAIGWFSRHMVECEVEHNLRKLSLNQHVFMKGAYFGGIVFPFQVGFFKTKYSDKRMSERVKKNNEQIEICSVRLNEIAELPYFTNSIYMEKETLDKKIGKLKKENEKYNITLSMKPTLDSSDIEEIVAKDANSLYPSVMYFNDFPTGPMTTIAEPQTTILDDLVSNGQIFIMDATVWVSPKTIAIPPFIKKTKTGNLMPVGNFRTSILSPTYIYALSMMNEYADYDFKILKIHIIYIWKDKTPLFRTAIGKLYEEKKNIDNKKQELKQTINRLKLSDSAGEIIECKKTLVVLEGERTVVKLLLNSIYGAFGIGVDSKSVAFKEMSDNPTLVTQSWTESKLVKNRNEMNRHQIVEWDSVILSHIRQLPIAALVSDYGRRELLKLANESRYNKNLKLLYCDTDSVYVLSKRKGAFDELMKNTDRERGAELGGWTDDLTGVVDTIAIWGAKIKGYEYADGESITMKGIPMSSNFLERIEGVDERKRHYIHYREQFSEHWFTDNKKTPHKVSYLDLKRIAIGEISYLKFTVRQIYVGKTVFLNDGGKIESKEVTKTITFQMNKGTNDGEGQIKPPVLNERI